MAWFLLERQGNSPPGLSQAHFQHEERWFRVMKM
jgi:hypothetical protein